jgi:hypothetical protein
LPTFDSDEERAISSNCTARETLHQLIEALGKKAAVEVIEALHSYAQLHRCRRKSHV